MPHSKKTHGIDIAIKCRKRPQRELHLLTFVFFFLRAVRNGEDPENFKSGGFSTHIYIHEIYLNTNFREARRLILSLCNKKVKKKTYLHYKYLT